MNTYSVKPHILSVLTYNHVIYQYKYSKFCVFRYYHPRKPRLSPEEQYASE
jgi:hypothetical protein